MLAYIGRALLVTGAFWVWVAMAILGLHWLLERV